MPRKNRFIPVQGCRSMRYHGTCVYKLRNGRPGTAYQHTDEDRGILRRIDRLSHRPDRRPRALSQTVRPAVTVCKKRERKFHFPLAYTIEPCYNRHCKEIRSRPKRAQKEPRRILPSGVLLCLLSLAVPVKPLADVITDYVCCDRHQKYDQNIQNAHLLSVAGLERAA